MKYIRDRAKSAYTKDSECYICGVQEKLELHHYYSLDLLFTKWCKSKGIKILSDEDIIACRDEFIADHKVELYSEVVTLCKDHHQYGLHKLFGQTPLLSTADKQKRWVENGRRAKQNT